MYNMLLNFLINCWICVSHVKLLSTCMPRYLILSTFYFRTNFLNPSDPLLLVLLVWFKYFPYTIWLYHLHMRAFLIFDMRMDRTSCVDFPRQKPCCAGAIILYFVKNSVNLFFTFFSEVLQYF